jgi:hypothetical protein
MPSNRCSILAKNGVSNNLKNINTYLNHSARSYEEVVDDFGDATLGSGFGVLLRNTTIFLNQFN